MPPPKRRKEPGVKPVAKEPEDLDALLAEFGVEVKEKSDTKKKKKEKKEPAADPGAGLNGSVAAATEDDRALEEKIDKLFAKDGKLEEFPSGLNGTLDEPAEQEDIPTAPSMDPEAIRKRLLAKGAGKGSTTAASARKSAAANLALSEAKERQKNMKSKKDEKRTTMGYKVRGG